MKASILTFKIEADWRDSIKSFLSSKYSIEDQLELRKVKTQVAHYCLVNGKLFKRENGSNNYPLKSCVKREDGLEIAQSINDGGNGAHQGWKTLYQQISCRGYFWSQAKKDAKDLELKYLDYQKHGSMQLVPSIDLTSL